MVFRAKVTVWGAAAAILLASGAVQAGDTDVPARIKGQLAAARTAYSDGDMGKMKSLVQKAVALGESNHLTNDQVMAETYVLAGVVQVDLEKHDRAVELFAKALKIRADIEPPDEMTTKEVRAAWKDAQARHAANPAAKQGEKAEDSKAEQTARDKAARAESEKLQKQLAEAQKASEKEAAEREKALAAAKAKAEQIERVEKEKGEKEKALAAATARSQEVEKEKAEKEKALAAATARIQQLEKEKAERDGQLAAAADREKKEREAKDKLQLEKTAQEKALAEAKARIQQLEKEKADRDKELAATVTREKQEKEAKEKLQKEKQLAEAQEKARLEKAAAERRERERLALGPDLPAQIAEPLHCAIPDDVTSGEDLFVHCAPQAGIKAKAKTLAFYYRSPGTSHFNSLAMQPNKKGWYMTVVPADHVKGATLQYYAEARDGKDVVLASNGKSGAPNIASIRVGQPADKSQLQAQATPAPRSKAAGRRAPTKRRQ